MTVKSGLTSVLAVLLAFSAGCTDMPGLNKAQMGSVLGIATGAGVGSQIGKGSGRVIAVAGLAAVGALVGKSIGAYLDEQDRQKLAAATAATADTGASQTIVSPSSGATIRTVLVPPNTAETRTVSKPPKDAQPNRRRPVVAAKPDSPGPAKDASPLASDNGRVCQTVRQTIVLKSGTQQEEDIRVCKGANGWEPA
jgi:outer membrane lipoprotein SlyB